MNKKYLIRFWDKKNKQMLYPNNKLIYESRTEYLVEVLELEELLSDADRFVPMRYIGTDKNNKDIWEKDIVIKNTYVDIDEGYNDGSDAVYLDRICRGIAYLTISKGAVLRHLTIWLTTDPYEEKKKQQEPPKETKLVFSRCSCIGNLYENEDLLLKENFEEL